MLKAAFLDRDGVINVNHGHVHTPETFEWVPGAPEAIKLLRDLGYLIIIITNQAGIAKGYYTEAQFIEFMSWIMNQAQTRGTMIDGYYYCPHHPTEGIGPYLKTCECRKPKPGLILKALHDYSLNPQDCLFIGDELTDMEAARRAGVAGFLFDHSNLLTFVTEKVKT